MIKDHIRKCYLEKECPCSESILCAVAEEYKLELEESTFRALGPFGGGIGVGHICGAITGGIASIGVLLYRGDKKSLSKSKKATIEFYEAMVTFFKSEMCFYIKKKWRKNKKVPGFKKSYGCLDVITKASELLDEILTEWN